MPYKYLYKGIHSCEAAVAACMDFRFWKETADFVEKELEIKTFDLATRPGGVRALNETETATKALKPFEISSELHHIKKIVLVNHEDCGAYGGSKKFENKKEEEEFHKNELKKAAGILKKKYKEHQIITVYARLSEDGSKIEFVKTTS